MRFVARLLVLTGIAAVLLVPAATAADRMWVGFHDDPMFRWDDTRVDALDRARGNEASILRTVVDWSKVAPSARRARPTRSTPPTQFGDVDEFVRNAQERGVEVLITLWGTPGWANGGQKPQAMPRNLADFQNFARAVASRYSGRFAGYPFVRFYTIWNESNLATFLVPQFDSKGRIVSPANYAKLAQVGHRGDPGGEQPRPGRDRRDVLERP